MFKIDVTRKNSSRMCTTHFPSWGVGEWILNLKPKLGMNCKMYSCVVDFLN